MGTPHSRLSPFVPSPQHKGSPPHWSAELWCQMKRQRQHQCLSLLNEPHEVVRTRKRSASASVSKHQVSLQYNGKLKQTNKSKSEVANLPPRHALVYANTTSWASNHLKLSASLYDKVHLRRIWIDKQKDNCNITVSLVITCFRKQIKWVFQSAAQTTTKLSKQFRTLAASPAAALDYRHWVMQRNSLTRP